MKIRTAVSMACFLLTAAFCGHQENIAVNQLTEQEKREGWQLLFDGESTKGWRGYNRSDVGEGWIVDNGVLACLGKGGDIGGDIITEEQFKDFELRFEWRIEAGGNSGVFYHVIEDKRFKAPYETGPEYQLIDDFGFPAELQPWQETGADYAMYPAGKGKNLNPAGEWNSTRILFERGHVEHWLNGEKILEFEAWSEDWIGRVNAGKWKDFPEYGKAKKGRIGLQDHGDKAWFRNIKIKIL
jgi:hypothetical protein